MIINRSKFRRSIKIKGYERFFFTTGDTLKQYLRKQILIGLKNENIQNQFINQGYDLILEKAVKN